jgi:hypothetical protein
LAWREPGEVAVFALKEPLHDALASNVKLGLLLGFLTTGAIFVDLVNNLHLVADNLKDIISQALHGKVLRIPFCKSTWSRKHESGCRRMMRNDSQPLHHYSVGGQCAARKHLSSDFNLKIDRALTLQ